VGVEVFVTVLRVGVVSGEGVGSIESAVERVVVPRAEVVLLGVNVELLTCIEQIRRRGIRIRRAARITTQHHAISVVGISLKDSCAGVVDKLPCRTVAVIEQILRSIDSIAFRLAEDIIADDIDGGIGACCLLEYLCIAGMIICVNEVIGYCAIYSLLDTVSIGIVLVAGRSRSFRDAAFTFYSCAKELCLHCCSGYFT
jgi:hypothetical protein